MRTRWLLVALATQVVVLPLLLAAGPPPQTKGLRTLRLNIFTLEESEGLARFMERLARLTKGRVFLMDDHRVGEFVLRDYVAHRSR